MQVQKHIFLLTFSLFIVILNQVSHFWRGLFFWQPLSVYKPKRNKSLKIPEKSLMICLKTPLHLSQFLQAIEAPIRPILFHSDTADNVTLPPQM